MDAPIKTFINNTRLIRTRTSLGYTYTWRFEDGFGLTVEMDMEEFSQYISDNLAMLRVKQNELF